MAETRYTPRLDLPYAIERGRSQVITLSVYSGSALTAPSSGTLTLYAPDGTSASSGSVSIVSDVAEYTVSGLTSYDYGEGWAVEWALTMPDGVAHTFRNDAALCRVAPQQSVTPADLYRREPYLDASSTGAVASETWVDQCLEAYVELQRRLWSRGRRPWQIVDQAALRQAELLLALSYAYRALASRDTSGTARDQAEHYHAESRRSWAAVTVRYDLDDDGAIEGDERTAVKPASVWLGSTSRPAWGAPWRR
jgi:hypothetical protein